MQNKHPRLLLAKLRNGDFAHAGETEAIDITLDCVKSYLSKPLKILDVGCGLGGTANYIAEKMSVEVLGIDIDADAIEYAKKKYPKNKFMVTDILEINQKLSEKFNFIYLFNVFYALADQQEALNQLNKIAEPGAILAIFDYVSLDEQAKLNITDFSGKTMQPVSIAKLNKYMEVSGWKLLHVEDLNSMYQEWYENFIIKLETAKEHLKVEFTEETYQAVLTTFTALLNEIKQKTWGGALIIMQKS